jgi:CheY-like chemotaxis protein
VQVLLVSDNARVNQQVKMALLGRTDVTFTEVAAPKPALHLIDEGGPGAFDVVVADNDMHPAGGLYLSREVKARGQMGRDVPPVVLLLAREQDVWLSNWSQADAYVLKPVDPFDFAEVVDAVVEGGEIPALPNVGGDPTPSLLDVPGGDKETGGVGDQGPEGFAGMVGGATAP